MHANIMNRLPTATTALHLVPKVKSTLYGYTVQHGIKSIKACYSLLLPNKLMQFYVLREM